MEGVGAGAGGEVVKEFVTGGQLACQTLVHAIDDEICRTRYDAVS